MTEISDISIPEVIKGYSQIRLDVDLTNGKISKSTLSSKFCADWIGGYGF